MYIRKTIDEYQIHVDYGQGWEHETTEETFADARRMRQDYRDNTPYPVRVVKVRVRIAPPQGFDNG